ncbi:flavodoxin [Haloimpatiens sp. FM7315]|uniref:flavodoxin n=1 Tax=Haloimpatiens sp. FM7315 TaxID=3298609 RepID=UPI00370BF238
MKNISVIFWSGSGNTEAMAIKIFEGAKTSNTKVRLLNVEKANIDDVINSDIVCLGCPAMGAEELEETIMEPFIESISSLLKGKKIALFGSYGWGDGEWMVNFKDRMEEYGAKLLAKGLIINGEPDESQLEECIEYGENLAKF